MDKEQDLRNEQNEADKAPERKPLYAYQRIQTEGPGFRRRENKKNGIKNPDREYDYVFTLPTIEKEQQGKFLATAGVLLLFVINLVALTRICSNLLYMAADRLLLLFHMDSLIFDTFTFMNLRVLTTYVLSFVGGGCVVYLLLKIMSVFSENGYIFQIGHIIRLILSFILLILSFVSLIKLIAGTGMYSYDMVGSMAPSCMYICSIIICLFSKQHTLMD